MSGTTLLPRRKKTLNGKLTLRTNLTQQEADACTDVFPRIWLLLLPSFPHACSKSVCHSGKKYEIL